MRHVKVILIASLLFMTACGSSVRVESIKPPRAGNVNVQRLAVYDIKGDNYKFFSTKLENKLNTLKNYDGQKYIVMDRENIELILKEQNFQMTMSPSDTMVEFGGLSGIDGIITGALRYSDSSRTVYENRSVKQDNKYVTVQVRCIVDEYSLNVSLKLLDVASARIIYSPTYSKSYSTKSCSDGYSSGGYTGDVFASLSEKIIDEVAKDLGETTISENVYFKSDTAGIAKEDRAIFTEANDSVEDYFDISCSQWESIAGNNQKSFSLMYNLGVCYEVKTDFLVARDYYHKARNINPKDGDLKDAIRRIEEKIVERDRYLRP